MFVKDIEMREFLNFVLYCSNQTLCSSKDCKHLKNKIYMCGVYPASAPEKRSILLVFATYWN